MKNIKRTLLVMTLFLSVFLLTACGDDVVYVEQPRYNQVKITSGIERGSVDLFIQAKSNDTKIDYVLVDESVLEMTKEQILNKEGAIKSGSATGIVSTTLKELEDDTFYKVFVVISLNNLDSKVFSFDVKTLTEIETMIKGLGTEEDPFIIEKSWQLAAITTGDFGYLDSSHYELVTDLDLLEDGYTNWVPIGKQDGANKKFSGVFNGNGHTISNLTIKSSAGLEKWGLFQEVAIDGIVHSLNFDNVDIEVEGFRVGTLVGYSKGIHYNIHVKNAKVVQPTGEGQIGGIIGAFYDTGSLQKSSFRGEISASGRRVGGLVGAATTNGANDRVYLSELYFEGTVTGTATTARQLAGILGAGTGVRISAVVANAVIDGVRQNGGVVGYIESSNGITSIIEQAIFIGSVSSSGADGSAASAGFILGNGSATKGEYLVDVETIFVIDTATKVGSSGSTGIDGNIVTAEQLSSEEFYQEKLLFFSVGSMWDLQSGLPKIK